MAWREDKCQLLINCFLCTCIWLGHDRDRAAGLALCQTVGQPSQSRPGRRRAKGLSVPGPNFCPREVTGIGAACRWVRPWARRRPRRFWARLFTVTHHDIQAISFISTWHIQMISISYPCDILTYPEISYVISRHWGYGVTHWGYDVFHWVYSMEHLIYLFILLNVLVLLH
jgi:hypothetical protein